MGFTLGVIFISALYIGEGALLSFIEFKRSTPNKDETFEFKWGEILSWPKYLF